MHGVATRLQAAARAGGRDWPGMIGVDQEGGVVARLRAPLTEWPAPMSYGAAASGPLAGEAGQAMASELAALGFNTDFAPTSDVTMGPADPTIGARSMSGDADAAAGFGVAFSRGMLAAGLLPAAKHFPGPRLRQRRFPCPAAGPGRKPGAAPGQGPETLPGRHRRRAADGHDRPHCRARA